MQSYLPLVAAPFIGLVLAKVVAACGEGATGKPLVAGMAAGAGAVALCAVLVAPDGLSAWSHCVLGWALLALAWIDGRHFRLPDTLTLPLLLLGLGSAWLLEPWLLTDRAIGAMAGYAALRLIGWGYFAWRGQDGLGQGDAKLLAAGGAWVGWEDLSWLVMLAALAGIAWTALRTLRGVRMTARSRLPFGPFLALGIWTVRMAQAWGAG